MSMSMTESKQCIMALDAGTTSSRCILFDENAHIISVAQEEFAQIYPKPGWVEHDAETIFTTQMSVAKAALEKAGLTADDVAAICIANQRETTIVWYSATGKPICNAIVWQCRRTAEYCDELKSRGLGEPIRQKTGLVIDAYFSGTKLRWILENIPGARERAERGELLFGTVETWLIWKLTEGRVHATDLSNASRTMLFNINTLDWDEELLKELGIPRSMLPEVQPSSGSVGEAAVLGGSIPILGAAGDQQAALFGQGCFMPGEAKTTYGTGCFILMNTGETPVFSKNGPLTTIAWGIDGRVQYALEGSIFMGGALVQWLRDELKLIDSAPDSEPLALSVENTNGCYVVPAFTGLGAPYWNSYARGTIVGLTRGCGRAHIVRASLDAIAYQVLDALAVMEKDSGIPLTELRADGGAANNGYLMQAQADLCGVDVVRPACVETTAMGAAYLAGLKAGFYSDVKRLVRGEETRFSPKIGMIERAERLSGWRRAVRCALNWAEGAE